MVLNRLVSKSAPVIRNFSTSIARNSHDTRGIVGSNLPYQIKNKPRLAAVFILFWGSGLALPFISVRGLMLRDKSE